MLQTKMATNRKAVLVTMYVEKPTRSLATNGHRHHHHHHHVHHTIKREVIHYRHDDAGRRYINRRAELLQYSQRLRKSAREPAFSPLISKQNSFNHQQTKSQALPVRRKAKDEETPACLANCNAVVPNFFRGLTSPLDKKERRNKKKNNKKKHSGSPTSSKIQSMMKSLQVKKKKGFISKLLSAFQKG